MKQSETNEWGLGDYLHVVRRNWLVILLCTVLGAAAGFAYSASRTPLYQSSTTLYVAVRSQSQPGAAELAQGGYYARDAVRSYVDIIDDALILERVIADLDLDMSVGALASMVSASTRPQTVLLNVDVVGPDPAQAAAIANAVGENFADVVTSTLEKPSGGGVSPVQVSTTQQAQVPSVPISPNTRMNTAFALLLGLAAGLAIALARTALDTRLTTAADLDRITELPVLGAILDDPRAAKDPLTVRANPKAPESESFRALRTNLQFVNVGGVPRSFVITSSIPGEGKSTVAANLAVSLAETGASVALVDADLRKPSVARFMGVDGAVGLSNLLAGMVDLEDVMHRWGRLELYVLPSGRIPPNPSELLGSKEMDNLLARLGEHFDYVLIDSPPVLAVTDAVVLSRITGGTILVAAMRTVRRADVAASLDALDGIARRLSGVVLNRAPSKGPDAYHYARYEYAKPPDVELSAQASEDRPLRWLDDAEAQELPRRHARP